MFSWLLLAACGSDGETVTAGDDGGSSPGGDSLADTSWVLIDGIETVPGTELTLSFENGMVGGNDGCNGFGGDEVDVADGRFALGPVGQTEIGCEAEVTRAAADYMQALFDSDTWSIDAGRLILTGSSTTLVFEAPPTVDDAELTGVTWLLTTVIQGDTASSALGTSGFLRLDDDGTLSGSTGCRDLSGEWILREGNRVVFTTFAADGACAPELVDQDAFVVTVLGDGFRAVVDGDRLRVTSTGELGLEYSASDGPAPD